MAEKPTYEALEQRIALLENESAYRKRFEEINRSLFKISDAVNITSSLDELFRTIHLALSPVIDTTNFFIAMYDKTKDTITFPYRVDSVDECYPPVIEVSKTASLTAEVIRSGRPVFVTKAERLAQIAATSMIKPGCTPSEIWLGVPLKTRDKIIGVIAVQSYHDPLCYDQTDMEVMVSVADQVAIAIELKQAEEILRLRESYLRAIIENQPGLVWLKDSHERFLLVNQAFATSCGKQNPDILLGKTDFDIWPTELAQKYRNDDIEVMKSAKSRTIEEPIFDRGVTRWFETFKKPIFDEQGSIIGTTGYARDITERKLAEQALRDAERFARETQRIARVGGWKANPHTDYLDWTEGVSEIIEETLDYRPSLTEGMKYFLPQNIPLIRDNIVSCLSNGEAFTMETEIITAKGRRLWTELRGIAPVVDGERSAVIGTFQDITQRKRAEVELRENRKRLVDIVNFLPDATLAIDKEKRVIIWNKAIEEMTGVPAVEMIGKGDYAYTVPFYGEARPQLMDLIFMDQGDVLVRYPKITREGDCLTTEVFCNALYDNKGAWIFAKASPLHDQSGNIMGAIESIRDITERKQAEAEREKLQAQLNQAQKMESVGRLAGGVAHDFNNMLQSITGNAEMALNEIDPTHPLHGKLSEILKVARRSADLTRQLLAFARKQTIRPIVLDLNETISGMLKMLHRLIGEDIDFSWKPALNLWPVRIDPSQIDQILVNLCVNARDAISGVGAVTIETENVKLDLSYCETHPGFIPGEYVQLAVIDTGMGIEKDMLDLIFEPFFTTKELGKGTGLGLSTVYGIVKQNDGFVNVCSEPGQGTIFRIYLPRTEDNMANTDPCAAKQRISDGTETVLLVEDDESILEIGKEVLERFGYTVLAAHNPNDALALARTRPGPIHILITDVIMPEMNGQELRHRLHDIQPELKVIFMSGYTANVIAHHGVLDKGINFLQKPFSLLTLAEKVREVLDEDSPTCEELEKSHE